MMLILNVTGPRSMALPLDSLPQELLAIIANHLNVGGLKNFRSLSRNLRNAAQPPFQKLFSELSVSLNAQSLAKFTSITEHEVMQPQVHSLSFELKETFEHDNYVNTRLQLRCGRVSSLLQQGFSNLKNCHTISFSLRKDYKEEVMNRMEDLVWLR
jgi:hypothetical protein